MPEKDQLRQSPAGLFDQSGYKHQVSKVAKEIGSGINDGRQKFIDLLNDDLLTVVR
jgi:hypothetical protein